MAIVVESASITTYTDSLYQRTISPPAGAVPGQMMIVWASSYYQQPQVFGGGSGWRAVDQSGGNYWNGATYCKVLEESDFVAGAITLYCYSATSYYPLIAGVVVLSGTGGQWDAVRKIGGSRTGYSYPPSTSASTTAPLTVGAKQGEMALYLMTERGHPSYNYVLAPSVDRGELVTKADGSSTGYFPHSAAIYKEPATADFSATATVTTPAYSAGEYLIALAISWPSIVGRNSFAWVESRPGYALLETPVEIGFIDETTGLNVLDLTLIQAPTTLTVTMNGLMPNEPVDFLVDGELLPIYQADVGDDGVLGPTSLPIDESVGTKGTHMLRARQDGQIVGTASFTIENDPDPALTGRGPDADPVQIPGTLRANGTRRWVLQDLMPGGLGSYIMELNPIDQDNPEFERMLEAKHTTALSGQYHVWEAGAAPLEWNFSGYVPTQDMHDKLVAFANLNRRFYLIDHRNRAWKVAFANAEMIPRLRQQNIYAELSDTIYDYTISALIYDQEWAVPQ